MKRALTSVRVHNFKALDETGAIKPGGLTVFIGDNGTGKSSVLEALRLVAALSRQTLDEALAPFGGFDHARWKGGAKRGRATSLDEPFREYHPIEITLRGNVGLVKATAVTRITGQNRNVVAFEHEALQVGDESFERGPRERPDRSILWQTSWFDDWQFLDMVPGRMGQPVRRTQSGARIRLVPDGSNLAEYILAMRDEEGGSDALEGLVETLQVILPYAEDVVPDLREGFEREVALLLHEQGGKGRFTVPGWMLSTGTLRLVALLALLRHPRPPSLLCVEEIENGLDPRTIQLVVNELLNATESGRTQIMVTTHSPYLLDLVPLDSLVLVERKAGSPPTFDRPASHVEVRGWAESFMPGRLYTMGTLSNRGGAR